ncbi:MAG: hypothetical protein FWF03_04575 [Defluviitaleaceae bacterium]|nr:hypothetical protein [Defluviitaleaceae bacterium]
MKSTKAEPHKSSLGMDANVLAVLIFAAMVVVTWIPYLKWFAWGVPLVVFLMEKESKFVKFVASQAFVVGLIRAALDIVIQLVSAIFRPIPLLNILAIILMGAVSIIIGIAITIVIVYLVVMAYGYKQVDFPIVAPLAKIAYEKLDTITITQNKGGGGGNDGGNDGGGQEN